MQREGDSQNSTDMKKGLGLAAVCGSDLGQTVSEVRESVVFYAGPL